MEQTNIKRTIIYIAYGLLIFSGFQKFVTIGGIESLNTFRVKGFLIALIAYVFIIYAATIKKSAVLFITYLIAIAGYGYTFYTVYQIYDNTITFELGLYLYALSAFVLLISIFVGNNKANNNTTNQTNEQLIPNNANIANYIYGTYLYGIEEKKEYSYHRCALAVNNTNDIILILTKENTFNYEIKHDQVESISVKKSLAMKKNTESFANHVNEDKMLGYALGGALGIMVADNVDNRDMGGQINYSASYLTEIQYKVNNESKKIVIELDKDPNQLLAAYSNLFIK